MPFGRRRVAQGAVGQRQRVVYRRGLGVAREHVFEMDDGATIVVPGQRRAPQTEPGRYRSGLHGERLHEPGLGGLRLPQLQIGVAEPHLRRDVGGLELARHDEQRQRLLRLATRAIQVRQIVRPAEVGGVQRVRPHEIGFGTIGQLRGHQQLAHLAVGVAQLGGVRARRCRRGQGRVAIAHLGLDGWGQPRDIGQGRGGRTVAARRGARAERPRQQTHRRR